MDELVIRKATLEDMNDISFISRSTWEGSDYLENTAPGWIDQGSLYAGELDGRIVGTFRISTMPERVLWLEALRVHPDFRGRGFGRKLASFVLLKGREIMRQGKADCLEFSTYVNNMESRHISESQGFKIVSSYMLLYKDNPEDSGEIVQKEPSWDDFSQCPEYISCGWKFVRTTREGFRWAMRNSTAWTSGSASFLMKNDSMEITPLAGSLANPHMFLDGAETAASQRDQSQAVIFLHESADDIINAALQRGFSTWEPVKGSNVLIYRYLDETLEII